MGSLSGSTASRLATNAVGNTARNVDGITTASNWRYPIPCSSRIDAKKTTAAEIGEAVIAIWDATTATDNGREGRSFATSAMTGSVEKAVCPVPAGSVMV